MGYKLKTPKIIEDTVVKAYKNIETGTVDAYKKVETGAVGAYKKIEAKFVRTFLENDGEPDATMEASGETE